MVELGEKLISREQMDRSHDTRTVEPIFGIPTDDITLRDAVDRLAYFLTLDDRCRTYTTISQYSLHLSTEDQAFREALQQSDMVTADGVGALLASKVQGGRLRHRVSGPDITMALLKRMNQVGGLSCFFLGSSDLVLERIRKRMVTEFPRVEVVGTYSPPYRNTFTPTEDRDMVEAINAVNPDLLLIGLTAPKQEKWAQQHRTLLRARLVLSVGAVFDFFAGTRKRAPRWMREHGMEWTFRLAVDFPKMWRRYLIFGPRFVLEVCRRRLRSGGSKPGADASME